LNDKLDCGHDFSGERITAQDLDFVMLCQETELIRVCSLGWSARTPRTVRVQYRDPREAINSMHRFDDQGKPVRPHVCVDDLYCTISWGFSLMAGVSGATTAANHL